MKNQTKMSSSKNLLLFQCFFLFNCFVLSSCLEDNNEDVSPTPLKKVKRRSQKQQNICRREFLRPLDKRIGDVDLVFKGIVEKVYSANPMHPLTDTDADENSLIEDDRDRKLVLKKGMQQIHPMLLYRRQKQREEGMQSDSLSPIPSSYRAIVRVKRVYKGSRDLQGSLVIVEGFGSDKICESNVGASDIRIFLVNRALFGRMKLMSSVLKVNQDNSRKIISLTKHRCHHFRSEFKDREDGRDDL